MNDTCILLFVKYPEAGKVKTRLGDVIGHDVAARLYAHFVQDMMQCLTRLDTSLRICYVPEEGRDLESEFRKWLGDAHTYKAQEGADLGERMKNAMQSAFDAGFSRVVLMGSDIPDYPCELVEKTLLDLDRIEAAIGPAYDGGYYLIGFRKDTFMPEIFDGIEWGHADVFRPTMERLRARQYEVLRLPDWNDVDTIWDLNVLFRTNRNSSFRKSSTYAILREYRELIHQYDIDLPVMPGRGVVQPFSGEEAEDVR